MKKLLLSFCLILLSVFSFAQGLECVEVEVYYVSDANDSVVNDNIPPLTLGALPAGSITYRVYANLLQGYNFQAGYGVNSPSHELRLETTTSFFNNEDRGNTSPTYTKAQAGFNTVMLDTWLSVGAACAGNYGIKKALDNGVSNVVNTDGALQNNDPDAGIPLSTQDGIILGPATPASVTFVGFTVPELDVINNSAAGGLISTYNASWAALGGSKGPDTTDNRVLIGQFTTKGVFSFKLNIQIGTPTGGVENYVAENPVSPEIMLPCLTFNSDSLWTDVEKQNASSSSPQFTVYPNPAQDFVMVAMDNTTRKNLDGLIRIYDMAGKIVFSKAVAASEQKRREQINISSLKSGIYFIEATIDGKVSHQKFVKN